MIKALQKRIEAARVALVALADRQAVDVPWHYGIQVTKLQKDLAALDTALAEDPQWAVLLDPEALKDDQEVVIPWKPGEQEELIFLHHGKIVAILVGIVNRLEHGPIARPDIGAEAAAILDPMIPDLNAEGFRLEPEEYRIERLRGSAPSPAPTVEGWPMGDNPDMDDLDLGRKF